VSDALAAVTAARESLAARAKALIVRLAGGARDDVARDALLTELLRWQAEHVVPYARLVRSRGIDAGAARGPDAMPALPTDVFRFVRVAAHAAERDVRVFRSSGTTRADRSTHAFADLSLYDAAARAAAEHALFPDGVRMRLALLVPTEHEAPESSLAYMLARFVEWFGTSDAAYVWRDDALDFAALDAAIETAIRAHTPLALLGTSFAFVHALEHFDARHEAGRVLPPGSRVMHTGGFKGRSREIAPDALRARMTAAFGVPDTHIVAEYGMTELSSQLYETTLRQPTEPRRLAIPGWMRIVAVDPESLAPVARGAVGILRIDDAANVDSVASIQTADLGRLIDDDGLEVLGRTPGATPRGCSLAADAALTAAR